VDVLRHVQLPFLIPSLVAVLILRTADTLKLFDMVFTMTRGGPGNGHRIHRHPDRACRQPAVRHRHGLAAQSIIMLAITIVLARLYIRFFYREVR
jgi:multiple sugar transport system permease protein